MGEYQQTDILLESGTNELEILEFEVGQNIYGINIAKVLEITKAVPVTEIPASNSVVEGIYNSRGTIISVVDLFAITKNKHIDDEKAMFIVCQFNQMTVAFHVGKVRGIQRISWEAIKEPPSISNIVNADKKHGLLTGIAQVNDELIMILDFERIIADINMDAGLNVTDLTHVQQIDNKNSQKQIVVVDDSPFLNKLIVESLQQKGFMNVKAFKNGADAWNYLQTQKDADSLKQIACVVSDIEMPQMDGHHLTKCIKTDTVLKEIPVYLFSSLINEQMRAKGEAVGADAQFSKPQIAELITALIKNIG